MTLVHHWSHPTTPAGPGWDIVIANRVRLETETGFSARAALGEADIVRVVVDDPNAEYDFKTLHRWYMVETDCPTGDQLVWNGYVGDQTISRASDGLLLPTGRVWTLDLVQENAILGFRVITGADGKRPAETAAARLRWLLASDYLATVKDHGLIDWVALGSYSMDAVDYRDQTAADVLRDISLVTGCNHYARYNEAYGDIELACYDPNLSTLDASPLQISNVPADVDFDTTWPASEDTEVVRQGSRVAAGVVVPFSGGRVYQYSYATSYQFGFRDVVAPSGNVKTQDGATALAKRLLAQHASQDERVRTRIQLPSSALNRVKHGQLIKAKLSHVPGWTSFRPARVVSRSFGRPANLTQAAYDVDLELSPAALCPNELPFVDGQPEIDDLFGGRIWDTAMGDYVPPFPPNPTTAQGYVYSNPGPTIPLTPTWITNTANLQFFGTPNANGAQWGISAAVVNLPAVVSARWIADFGKPQPMCLCVASFDGGVDPNVSVEISDDGVHWTEVISKEAFVAATLPQSFNSWTAPGFRAVARYVAMRYDLVDTRTGLGYLRGLSCISFGIYAPVL